MSALQSAAARAKFEQKCPECGGADIVEDHSAGDLVCRACGVVLEAHAIDEHSEWRTFKDSDKAGADPTRVGAAMNPLLEDGGMSLQIMANKGDGGAASALNRVAMQSNPSDRNFVEGCRNIARLCDQLSLTHLIKQRSHELLRQALDEPKTKVKGAGNSAVYIALVYIACKQEGMARTFKELLTVVPGTGVKEVGKYYKAIVRELKLQENVGVISVAMYMRRFGSNVGLSKRELNVAEDMANAACPKDGVRPGGGQKPWDGKNPATIAGAVLYMLTNHPKSTTKRKPLKEISMVCGMANSTISAVYRDMLKDAGTLLPKDWNLPEDVAQLPSVAV